MKMDFKILFIFGGVICATQGQSCNEVKTQTNGILHSPNYPGYYPNSAKCVMKVIGPPNHYIRLIFVTFHLSAEEGDFLQIQDGSGATKKTTYTGYKRMFIYRSTSSSVTITFQSNQYKNAKGFQAYYFVKPNKACSLSDMSNLDQLDCTHITNNTLAHACVCKEHYTSVQEGVCNDGVWTNQPKCSLQATQVEQCEMEKECPYTTDELTEYYTNENVGITMEDFILASTLIVNHEEDEDEDEDLGIEGRSISYIRQKCRYHCKRNRSGLLIPRCSVYKQHKRFMRSCISCRMKAFSKVCLQYFPSLI